MYNKVCRYQKPSYCDQFYWQFCSYNVEYISPCSWFELFTTLVVIVTDDYDHDHDAIRMSSFLIKLQERLTAITLLVICLTLNCIAKDDDNYSILIIFACAAVVFVPIKSHNFLSALYMPRMWAICVLAISSLPLPIIFLLDCGTFLTVWYFSFFHFILSDALFWLKAIRIYFTWKCQSCLDRLKVF